MNRKRLLAALAAVLLLAGAFAVARLRQPRYERFTKSFFGTFDTVISIIGYAESQAVFDREAGAAQELFTRLHEQFDRYHTYPGLNNLRVVNQQAAQHPVQVPGELYELIAACLERQAAMHDTVNIAMGAVLELWHDAREAALARPSEARLPDRQALEEAAGHMRPEDIALDPEARTIAFADPLLQLDLGAAAKGYATELVAQRLLQGPMTSFIINAGGNVRTGRPPLDGRANWGVAVQDPDGNVLKATDTEIMETLFVHDLSVVTSGDYQRFFEVDGVRYHHIVSPKTLMPPAHMRLVSILTEDSGYADMLSTAVFLMPYEEGRAFVESLPGVEAVWVLNDRSVRMTKGAETYARSHGATNETQ